MKTDMRISVVVPVYNQEKYIAACLDSILAQTYPDIEIVVVDDGSVDSSARIISEYAQKDPRIHAIFKENGGVTDARMAGIKESTGEWIGFVDGDDTVEPDMYSRLMENAMKKDADISHCGYRICFPDGRENMIHDTKVFRIQDTALGMTDLLEGSLIEPSLCTKIFRKELFQDIENLIPKTIKNNEDLLMNYYLFKKSRQSVFEDWCPYHYMVHEKSASRAPININRIYDPITVREIIIKDCSEEILPYARKSYLICCMHTFGTLINENDENVHEHKENVRARIIEHDSWADLLPRKSRLFVYMIRKHPRILQKLYPWYLKYIQKNQYN